MYKYDLAVNNLQWLICHKTKPNLNSSHVHKTLPITPLTINQHLWSVVLF